MPDFIVAPNAVAIDLNEWDLFDISNHIDGLSIDGPSPEFPRWEWQPEMDACKAAHATLYCPL